MTREEAIKRIKMILEECTEDEDAVCYVTSDDADALDTAIKALKQEPCEDCISRQAAIDVLRTCYDTETVTYTNGNEYIDYDQALDLLNSLPTVQPEPSIPLSWIEKPVIHAHWYFDPDKSIGCGITVSGMFCSNCGSDCPTGSHPYRDFKYCPHCGAKMDGEV